MGAEKKRLLWLDAARFLGILAIVLGHALLDGPAKKYVYTFHVPLFFFLQGVTAGIAYQRRGPGAFLLKKARALLVPYYGFALLSTALILGALWLVPRLQGALAGTDLDFSDPGKCLWQLLLGYCDANRPLWFLPCSFVLAVLAYPAVRFAKEHGKTAAVCLGMAALSGLFILCNECFWGLDHLFWKAETAVYMLLFYFSGFAFQELGGSRLLSRLPRWGLLAAALPLLVLGGWLGMKNIHVQYLSNTYGSWSLFLSGAFCSVLGIVALSTAVPSWKAAGYVGARTLPVLLMHKFPVLLFQKVLPFTKDPLERGSLPVGLLVSAVAIILCCVAERLFASAARLILREKR